MGSPVSVVVANLVMEDVEERALATFSHPPQFWKRYVNDICVAINRKKIQDFLYHLNTIEESIQFTVESDTNGLPFWMFICIDVRMAVLELLCIENQHIVTTIWISGHTTLYSTELVLYVHY